MLQGPYTGTPHVYQIWPHYGSGYTEKHYEVLLPARVHHRIGQVPGEEMSCMEDIEARAKQLLCVPVDPYVQEPALFLSPEAPAIKALAIMEQNDTSYLFVVDKGQYQGAVTIQSLAKMLIQLDQC